VGGRPAWCWDDRCDHRCLLAAPDPRRQRVGDGRGAAAQVQMDEAASTLEALLISNEVTLAGKPFYGRSGWRKADVTLDAFGAPEGL